MTILTALFKWLVTTLPATVLVSWIVHLVRRHDVRVFGRRERIGGDWYYVFGMFNAEQHRLQGRVEVELRSLLAGGQFLRRPALLSGPRTPDVATDWRAPGLFVARGQGIAPFATWLVQCATNGQEGDVAAIFRHSGREERITSSSRQDPHALHGLIFYCMVTAASMLTYAVVTTFGIWWTPVRSWHVLDTLALALIAVSSLLVFVLCRRPRTPFVEGYVGWERQEGPTWAEHVAYRDEAAAKRLGLDLDESRSHP